MHVRLMFAALLLGACFGCSSENEPDTIALPDNANELAVEPPAASEEIPQLASGEHGYSQGLKAATTLGDGWSGIETWGTWSLGSTAVLNFAPDRPSTEALDVFFTVFPPPVDPAFTQTITVSSDAFDTETWVFLPEENHSCIYRRVKLREAVGTRESFQITFNISNPTSPAEYGQSEDTREVGFGLMRIYESSADTPPANSPC